ncbi:hypothetical protein B0H14DRAFT_3430423 [Mycena olivaceomarginata]|nr:hypothetical protein B0H14DRAFT_3430423 [Mycena olivaceomarginata]
MSSSPPSAYSTVCPRTRSERHCSASTPLPSTSGSSNGHGGDLTLAPMPSRLGAERGALATRLSGRAILLDDDATPGTSSSSHSHSHHGHTTRQHRYQRLELGRGVELVAPFGVHHMALAGKAAWKDLGMGKNVGMWFGLSGAAGVVRSVFIS